MTLGEKIKAARQNAGLTQEEMASKLMVSRPAIAKWESDRGMPDIENLKAIGKLLNVSLDYLVGEGEDVDLNVLRTSIDLSAYGKGSKKKRKDRLMRDTFPEETICTLIPRKVLTKGEKIADNLLGFVFNAPFGIPDFLNGIKLVGSEYYLVEQGNDQYLVQVSDEFMQTRRLREKVESNKYNRFPIGDMLYISCGPSSF